MRGGLAECMELLGAFQPRVPLYPGSFNPFHLGHLSTLRQEEASFDKVIVGLGISRQKAGAAEEFAGRLAELRGRLRYHEVTAIDRLVTRFLDELRPGTNVVWIACEPELQHLSSISIRELEVIEPGAGARYVPGPELIYGRRAE